MQNSDAMWFLIAFLAVIYFIPTFIAARREHRQFKPILIINLFLGWSFLGWVIALAWASAEFE